MKLLALIFACLLPLAVAAEKPSLQELKKLAASGSPQFREAFPAKDLKAGNAYAADGPEFVFAVETDQQPSLLVDEKPAGNLSKAGAGLWYGTATLKTGTVHSFSYLVNGAKFGGRTDVPSFGPYSYEKPGVPKGKLSEKMVHTSHIYEGMQSNYWVYAPAQYDPKVPAAVMIWQDGEGLVNRELPSRAQIVFDNLTYEKKIPVIVHVLISPGTIGTKRMRSVEYDSVNDRYPRFLRDEILAEVSKTYNLRKDGYSRALAGNSSGGICAFNGAWQMPDEFSRVLSRIGSFTSIQWQPGVLDGGNVYPNKIRKEPHRNIRAWLQDGANDLENEHGSWPLQNIQMANSLKLQKYDFHLSWGHGTHNGAGGHAELPEEMIWLWRDYDPAKTAQTYEMDPAEKDKPMFRVEIVNR